ncbi:hypothetical protein GCM10011502_14950 [Oceanisphaera marina]|uniref:PepSY domain-containing protein n=1 Tax=Oceanisphaera marina TaxID=2017550 RepID=A0ABQ1IJM2_9GAMM|nr:hypothetical protein [Oceanisphaera marina]GGB42638.1 hypothetical protein GCM10011502_14950 [Oceanisphaera marina]
MKNKILLSLTTLAFAFTAHAAQDPIPDIIFVPDNARVVEAEEKWFGGFELEADISNGSLASLGEQVKAFYTNKGFELDREQADDDDIELLFMKEQESVEVDIELEHNEIIEYSVDYETR